MQLQIYEWIDKRGLKKQYVIKELGITYETLRRWQLGITDAPFSKMVRLAELLGVKLEDLYK